MASFARKVIRARIRGGRACRAAPRPAGSAFELFCRTPNPTMLSEAKRAVGERAAAFMAEARHHRLSTRTGCVMVHEFRPRQGRANAGHGAGHPWLGFAHRIHEGADRGLSRCRLPGRRRSICRAMAPLRAAGSPWSSAVDAVRVAGEWFGPFAAIVGHSFGGAVAANALAGSVAAFRPLRRRGLVLIAAPSSMPAIFEDFGRFLNLGRDVPIAPSPIRSSASPGVRSKQFVGSLSCPRPGRRRWSSMRLMTARFRPIMRELYARRATMSGCIGRAGLGHRRILSDPEIIGEALRFLAHRPALVH